MIEYKKHFAKKSYFFYRRWLGSEEYLVCINPLDVPEAYAIEDGWQTALANQNVRIDNSQLTLEPFGYVILKKL